MGSTVYQRGEVAGQRKLLALLLRERFEQAADPFLPRLQQATEAVLTQIGKLLARKHSDEAVLETLDTLLPQAGEPSSE